LLPEHIEGDGGVIVILRVGLIVTVIRLVPVHPLASVTVTVYVVVDIGLAMDYKC